MLSLINNYTSTRDKLYSFMIKSGLEEQKSKVLSSTLMERATFLFFFEKYSLTKDDYTPDNLWISDISQSLNFVPIIFNELLSIDKSSFKVIDEQTKKFTLNELNKYKQNFNLVIEELISKNLDMNRITSIIYEAIYNLDKGDNQGAVHTPFLLTEWIVSNCIHRYLGVTINNRLSESKLRNFTILDISVGCGNFFLASLKCLLSIFVSEGSKRKKLILRILKNNIYGIDIDQNSIKICKLRVILYILKEEPSITSKDVLDILNTVKIKTGNTLFGFISKPKKNLNLDKNNYDQQLFDNIIEYNLKESSFIEKDNVFHWFIEFPSIFNEKKDNGFDIIVGNPPWIGYRHITSREKTILKYLYPEIYTGLNDYYYYFIARGLQLLNSKGKCSLITSRYFLEAKYAKKLRLQLIKHRYIDIIIDLRGFRIFPKGINSAILFLDRNRKSKEKFDIFVLKKIKVNLPMVLKGLTDNLMNIQSGESIYFQHLQLKNGYPACCTDIMASDKVRSILNTIKAKSSSLGNVCLVGTGYHSGNDDVFTKNIVQTKHRYYGEVKNQEKIYRFLLESELIERRVTNRDILPFTLKWSGNFVLMTKHGIEINKYPLTKTYLDQFESLTNRYEVRKGQAKQYEIAQFRNKSIFRQEMKIICPYRTTVPRFALDKEFYLHSIDCCSIALRKTSNLSIYYLLGILNSEFVELFLYIIAKKLDGHKIELYPNTLSEIPIIIPNTKQEEIIAQKIMNITKKLCELLDYSNINKRETKLLIKKGKYGIKEIQKLYEKSEKYIDELDSLVNQLYGIESKISLLRQEIIKP